MYVSILVVYVYMYLCILSLGDDLKDKHEATNNIGGHAQPVAIAVCIAAFTARFVVCEREKYTS